MTRRILHAAENRKKKKNSPFYVRFLYFKFADTIRSSQLFLLLYLLQLSTETQVLTLEEGDVVAFVLPVHTVHLSYIQHRLIYAIP